MILQKLFKPKWQHKDPKIRRQALLEISDQDGETPMILKEIALQDGDEDLRRLAVKRLSDLQVIDEVLSRDKSEPVLDAAKQRLSQLLAGKTTQGPQLQQRIDRALCCDDPKILEYLARQAKESDLRRRVMEKINRDSVLGDMAIEDPDGEIRMGALIRIQSKSTLERVYKAVKGKDKKVSQIARQRLQDLEETQKKPQQILQQARHLCVKLEALIRQREMNRLAAQLQLLKEQWNNMMAQWNELSQGDMPSEIEQRYQGSLSRADRLLGELRDRQREILAEESKRDPIRSEKQGIVAALEGQAARLETAASDSVKDRSVDEAEALSQSLEVAEEQWLQLETLPREEENRFRQRFMQAKRVVQNHIKDIRRCVNYHEGLRALTGRLNNLKETHVTLAQLEKIRESKNALLPPSIYEVDKALENAYLSRFHELEQRARGIEGEREQNRERLLQLIENFCLAVREGKVSESNDLKKQIGALEEKLWKQDLKHPRINKALKEYGKVVAEFGELMNWRTWANVPVKEQLCEEVEAFVAELRDESLQHNYNNAAQYIKEKREQWKKLGKSAAGEREFWQRFNEACNEAYGICKRFFQNQSQVRKGNRERKEKICEDLELYLRQNDWEQTDWNAVEKIINAGRREWREAGPVDRKFNHILSKRFQEVIATLKERLDDHLAHNQTAKETIIEEAARVLEELGALADPQAGLRDAVNHIKNLQVRWKKVGKAARERDLWKKFRKSCDSVFQLRDEAAVKKEEVAQEVKENKSRILEQLQELADLDAEELLQQQKQFQQLLGQWNEMGPSRDDRELNARIKEIRRTFSIKKREAQQRRRRRQFEAMQDKSDYCLRLESQLVAMERAPESELPQQWRQQWQAFGVTMNDVDRVLDRRLDRIVDLASDPAAHPWSEWQQQNQQEKSDICTRLEIIAGLDSPPQEQSRRMKLQVDMLQGKLTGNIDDDPEQRRVQVEQMLQRWYGCGLALEESGLNERFERAINQVLEDEE